MYTLDFYIVYCTLYTANYLCVTYDFPSVTSQTPSSRFSLSLAYGQKIKEENLNPEIITSPNNFQRSKPFLNL